MCVIYLLAILLYNILLLHSHSMNKEQIGADIKSRRLQLGLTQKQLAEKLNIQVQHIPNIEKGITNITISRLLEICEALRLEIKLKPIPKQKP
jgi:transcriptional regulator with XRE-family HTH domain